MTLPEALALSDEELRGWAWTLAFCDKPTQNMVSPEGYATISRARVLVPDYPHEIAAAMDLFAMIPMPCGIERGYESHYGVGPIGFHVGFGALPQNHDEDDVWAETVWNEESSRAIAMAFILAMTREATA